MTVDVTVLSVWYNRSSTVDLSLQSLTDQTCDTFRAIIVDDGSTDDTLERLERHRSDRIHVQTQRNSGFTPTMARIAAEVETPFIAIHGAGDESLPERLALQRDYLLAHPHVVAVGCGIENIDLVSGRHWEVRPRQPLMKGPIFSGFGISHGEVMFRRDAYLQSGGYRSAFRFGQATDLFRRLSRIGDFGFLDAILYRRYLTSDGVNADLPKLAERDILDTLSSIAHRRESERDGATAAQLRDDIDRYGLLLPYMLPRDRLLSTNLARAAIKFWTAGDRNRALILASRALREYPTMRSLSSYLAIRLGVGPLRGPLQSLTLRASGGAGELNLQRISAASANRTGENAPPRSAD